MKLIHCLAEASLVCHFASFPKSINFFYSGIGAYNSHYFINQGKSLWPLLSSRENETLIVQ